MNITVNVLYFTHYLLIQKEYWCKLKQNDRKHIILGFEKIF